MKVNKLFLLILPLLFALFSNNGVSANADDGIQDFYRKIETDANGWVWDGFELFENTDASRCWEHGTFEANKTGTYRFKGNSLSIVGYKGVAGGSIEVDIDGETEEVSLEGIQDSYQNILYTSAELSDDWHTLTITSLEEGKWHCIDAIIVNINKEAYLQNYNLAQVGKIICSVMNPTGGGNKDINVIRNEKIYEVGTSGCGPAQYDSFNGSGKNYFYIGFEFEEEIPFSKFVFQEGDTWFDGGWFANGDIKVEVRQDGIWTPVELIEEVNYPKSNLRKDFGVSCEIFTFKFETIEGDAIRLIGLSGGSSNFVSIAQVEVYSNAEALTLHNGYNYKDACVFEIESEENPPVGGDDNTNDSDNSEKGCGGTIIPSLIVIAPAALVLLIKKRKISKEEE